MIGSGRGGGVPRLEEGTVHVWSFPPDLDARRRGRLECMLAEDERARAERFVLQGHRDRFIAGRGMLRLLLGSYVGVPGGSVRFGYGAWGKPFLVQPPGHGVEFSLAHSRSEAVCALTIGRRVGVDLECAGERAPGDIDGVARIALSRRERADLERCAAEQRAEAFLRCWTRKEAFVKAMGLGLTAPLAAISVSFLRGDAPAIIEQGSGAGDPAAWSVFDISRSAERIAAMVVEGRDVTPLQFGLGDRV